MTQPAFDPAFLSVDVPLPTVPAGVVVRELPFTHFTVLLQPDRRLAVLTAVNLDGEQLLDLDRGDDWHLDPRVPEDEQTGPEVYADNDLDRGHLVRRRDPVWGTPEVAAQANLDTFSYVNAAPQAALFNQGELLWLGLETYVLTHASTYRTRLSVFTAPVLAPDDPYYRGLQVPRRFWKIVAWATDGPEGAELAATGYLLDQSDQLSGIIEAVSGLTKSQAPDLGPYLTFQVPVADIAAHTGLDLGPLPAADRFADGSGDPDRVAPAPGGPAVGPRWRLLQQPHEMVL